MSGHRILLVSKDDHVTLLRQKVLQMAGFSVVCADNSAAVELHLQSTKIDAVIIGYTVPEDEQTAICRQIRTKQPNAPILAIYKVSRVDDCSATRHIHSLDGPDAMIENLKDMLHPSN